MRPEVRASFPSWTDQFEGCLRFPYTDIYGLLTCGRGNLIDNGLRRHQAGDPLGLATSARALVLPWEHPDGSLVASADVDAAWWIVKRAWPGVQSAACARLTTIRLSAAAVDALTFTTLDIMWRETLKKFPDAERWPGPAQRATLSMDWAMGDNFEPGYPHFVAAALAQDWATCAVQCWMNESGNPGLHRRNVANRALFEEALTQTPTAPGTPVAIADAQKDPST